MPREVERPYDAKLAKALAHPLRAQILERLERHTASPSELADELAAPLGNVSYHVRILADAGLIELVRTTRRRGATEHHYRAVPELPPGRLGLTQTTPPQRAAEPPAGSAGNARRPAAQPDPPKTGPSPRVAHDRRRPQDPVLPQDPVRDTVEEIRDRVRAADHDDREATAGAHVTRTPLVLDDLAWEELHEAVEQLHDLALRLQLESAPRLRRVQHADEREANLVLMLFESSDPAPGQVLRGGVGERRRSTGRPK
jgi:DNA-binding transcriptional ArsR family regulator